MQITHIGIEKGPRVKDMTCDAPDAVEQYPLSEAVCEYQIDEEIRILKECNR